MTNTTNPVFTSTNRLKIGTFCTNGKGAAMTTVPESYKATWPLSVRTAQMADRAGFEVIVPYARWKGYVSGKGDDATGNVMDPYTWAAGLSQVTEQIGLFATSRAPTVHPIMAAKQCATIDIMSGGRFGLNVVGGWNKPELEMFGAPLKEHDKRYDHLTEWLQVLKRLWPRDSGLELRVRRTKQTQLMPKEMRPLFRQRFVAGAGGLPLVGSRERIADKLVMTSECGVDGMLLTWVDYVNGLTHFNRDVLPILEQRGVRRRFERDTRVAPAS